MKTELLTLPGKVRFYSQKMPLPPVTHAVFDGSPLTAFHPVSESTVREMLTKTAIKTCQLDSLPSFTSVINDSILTGSFPSVFKSAVFRPLLKTPTLDTENVTNYRPVSNLPFLSKITEKIVLLLLSQHLKSNHLLYSLQSAYRSGQSTETALLINVNDFLAALYPSLISLMVSVDVKHHVYLLFLFAALDVIHISLHFSTVLSWFQSYLSDRTQVVSVNGVFFAPAALKVLAHADLAKK